MHGIQQTNHRQRYQTLPILELLAHVSVVVSRPPFQEVSICTFEHKILHGLGTQYTSAHDSGHQPKAAGLDDWTISPRDFGLSATSTFDQVVVRRLYRAGLVRPTSRSLVHLFFQFNIPAKTSWSIRATRPPSAGLLGGAVIDPSRLMYSIGHRDGLSSWKPMDDLMTLDEPPWGHRSSSPRFKYPSLPPSISLGRPRSTHQFRFDTPNLERYL